AAPPTHGTRHAPHCIDLPGADRPRRARHQLSGDVQLSAGGPPLHLLIDAVVDEVGEAEAAIEPHRRLELLDHDADGSSARAAALLQGGQHCCAEAEAAPARHQGDVDDIEPQPLLFEIEPAGPPAAVL